MTPAQNAMYFAEFGKLRDVLRARGKSNIEIETHRGTITVKALGRPKSSKLFTNADLDKVIAEIKAQTSPGDFASQMRIQDSPDVRRKSVLAACEKACWEMYQLGENGMANHDDKYIAAVARNVVKTEVDQCTAEQLAIVLGCLNRKLAGLQKKRAAEDAARMAKAAIVPTAEVSIASPTKQLIAGEDY